MSTLSDALRKHGRRPDLEPETPDENTPRAPRWQRLRALVILLACAVAGVAIGFAVLPALKGGRTAVAPDGAEQPEVLSVPVQAVEPASLSSGEPPVAPDAPHQPTYSLSGIIYDPFRPSALVNGRLVHVGDEVDGAVVVLIGRDRVLISDHGEQHNLFLDR